MESPVKSTVISTGTTQVVTGPGNLYGIVVDGSAVGTWTLTIYDNTSGTTNKIHQIGGAQGAPGIVTFSPNFIPFHTGLDVVLATAPTATLFFNA